MQSFYKEQIALLKQSIKKHDKFQGLSNDPCRFQVLLKILHLSDDLVYIYLELSESKKLKTKVETTFVLKCFAVCG